MSINLQPVSEAVRKALQPKGINSRVAQKDSTLQIFLQSAQPINKDAVTTFLASGVKKLNLDGITKVVVYAKVAGQSELAWSSQVELTAPSAVSVKPDPKSAPTPKQERTSPAKSKLSPWLLWGTGITALIALPTGIGFVIPGAIGGGIVFSSFKKGERDKTKLIRLWCKSFLLSFGGLVALGIAARIVYPGFSKFVPQAETVSTPAPTSSDASNSSCKLSSGNMWTGVRVYLDSNCQKPFATILGGTKIDGERVVVLRFDSGETEIKKRSAVAAQAYVLSDDPAMSRMEWQEF